MFIDEYKESVKLEAEYVLFSINRTADEKHYERDIFLSDVVKEIYKQMKKEVEE